MEKPIAASALNKALAFGLATTLVVWTFGVFMALPAQAVDQHPNGSLVVSGTTVYKIMDGQRWGFPSANVFMSHGYEWSEVVSANSADLALPQAANVMFADGTLVNDNGTVFVVFNGQKRGFTSASVFTGLGFKFANVINDSTAGYTQGTDISDTAMSHPAGTLVNYSGTIWMITGTGRAGIPSLAVFNSWGLDFADVTPANAADLALGVEANVGYRVGTLVNDSGTVYAITSSNGKQGFPTASCYTDFGFMWSSLIAGSTSGLTAGANLCTGVTPPPGPPPGPTSTGNLSVSLASDTPASGIAIKGAARVPFTKINLTASGGDVVIDSWVVQRMGTALDSDFSSVDIVDLSTNATINDIGKTFNSDHTATFSEDLTLLNGTSKSVMLACNMASSPGAGDMPALALTAITTKGGTVSVSLPILGNGMTINTAITIGTATVSRGAYSNATSTALEVGRIAYNMFSFQVNAGATEDISFSQVKVYQTGSASLATDLKNIKLYRDGTFLANGVVSVNNSNYVNFSFPAETILKGQTNQYIVQVDVAGGSGRTVQLGIYRTTDLLVIGKTYNAGITPGYTGTGAHINRNPVLVDNTATISTGTLQVGRSSTVAATNITICFGQVLGAVEFEAKGEPVRITALTLTITSTTSNGAVAAASLQSVRLVDANGNTVAGPTDPTVTSASVITVALTDTFTVPVGTNAYKVVATLTTSGNWSTNDTIYAGINTPGSAITARGETTGNTITATPSSNITTATQTVKTAGLTVTKNSTPTNQSVITNSQGVLAGSWTFDATNSGEDIRITAIGIAASSTGKTNNLTLKWNGTSQSPVNSAPTAGGNPRTTAATSTFALTSPIVVTKGTSGILNLYIDVGSNSNAGEVNQFGITSNAAITAYGLTTGNAASVSTIANDGALLTIAAAGTLTITQDASQPASRLVVHGTSGVTLAEVRLKATNESVDITKLTVRVEDGTLSGTATSTFSQIAKVFLKLDGAVVGSASGYSLGQAETQINFNRGDLTIPADSTGKKLSILGDVVALGTNEPGTANADIRAGLRGKNGFTATGNGSNSGATVTYTDSTGTAFILHKAVPAVTFGTPAAHLASTVVLNQAKVSAVGGTVGLYALTYSVATSSGTTATAFYTKLTTCGGACGSVVDGSQLSASANGTYLIDGTVTINLPVSNSQSHGKRYLAIAAGGTATIDLYATVGRSGSPTADSISTSLLGDTATTVLRNVGGSPAAVFTKNDQGNFVWSDINLDESQAASSLTSLQWYNGYLASGLGATATSTAQVVGN